MDKRWATFTRTDGSPILLNTNRVVGVTFSTVDNLVYILPNFGDPIPVEGEYSSIVKAVTREDVGKIRHGDGV